MLKHLDLFSGIGGFALAANWSNQINTTQFVEIDRNVWPVLQSQFPGVPIHDDITTFTPEFGQFDLITAGFPCQDLSIGGKQSGLDGERSGLFFEIIRIVRQCRPRYILLENVAALLTSNKGRDMGAVLQNLSQVGYDAEWEVVSASTLGANHKRERLWIIAYPNSLGRAIDLRQKNKTVSKRRILPPDDQGQILRSTIERPSLFAAPRLSDIANFPRASDGLPNRMDNGDRNKTSA